MVRSQGHEPQALADEIVARVAIAGASGHGERAFTIRLERWLGQQVTREGIHVTSVDAHATPPRRADGRDCGQVRAGDARQAPMARPRIVRCCCSRAMSSPNIRL